MNEDSHDQRTRRQFEARIVALVLGEASDFERDELNQLMGERPELAAMKARIQQLHGLLENVVASEPVDDDEEWKLSADKRKAVLAVIDGKADVKDAPSVNRSRRERKWLGRDSIWRLTRVAAVFCLIAISVSVATLTVSNRSMMRTAQSLTDAEVSEAFQAQAGATRAFKSSPSDFASIAGGKALEVPGRSARRRFFEATHRQFQSAAQRPLLTRFEAPSTLTRAVRQNQARCRSGFIVSASLRRTAIRMESSIDLQANRPLLRRGRAKA